MKTTSAEKNNISFILPVLIMLGIYLVVNGHISPGGGFQGGAALSSVLICRYLVRPAERTDLRQLQKIEKYFFLALTVTALAFAVSGLYLNHGALNPAYLIFMNSCIGVKVFCGLSIIFFRFVHYENQ